MAESSHYIETFTTGYKIPVNYVTGLEDYFTDISLATQVGRYAWITLFEQYGSSVWLNGVGYGSGGYFKLYKNASDMPYGIGSIVGNVDYAIDPVDMYASISDDGEQFLTTLEAAAGPYVKKFGENMILCCYALSDYGNVISDSPSYYNPAGYFWVRDTASDSSSPGSSPRGKVWLFYDGYTQKYFYVVYDFRYQLYIVAHVDSYTKATSRENFAYWANQMTSTIKLTQRSGPGPGPTPGPPGGDDTSHPEQGSGVYEQENEPVAPPNMIPGSVYAQAGAVANMYSIYNPSIDQLQAFATKLFANDSLWQQIKNAVNSPLEYIAELAVCPFTPTKTADNKKIIIKGIAIGDGEEYAVAPKIENQYETVNMGNITINEKWGNFMDYAYTTVQIYLPFIGWKYLDNALIMGKELNLRYNVDMITGDCIAILYLTTDDGPSTIYTFTGNCFSRMPLQATSMSLKNIASVATGVGSIATGMAGKAAAAASAKTLTGPAGMAGAAPEIAKGVASASSYMVQNVDALTDTVSKGGGIASNIAWCGPLKPYVLIQRPAQNLPENFAKYNGYTCNQYLLLGDLSGYTEISQIHLDGFSIDSDELMELERILQNGVIF